MTTVIKRTDTTTITVTCGSCRTRTVVEDDKVHIIVVNIVGRGGKYDDDRWWRKKDPQWILSTNDLNVLRTLRDACQETIVAVVKETNEG